MYFQYVIYTSPDKAPSGWCDVLLGGGAEMLITVGHGI
jgi:hypothetical protein